MSDTNNGNSNGVLRMNLHWSAISAFGTVALIVITGIIWMNVQIATLSTASTDAKAAITALQTAQYTLRERESTATSALDIVRENLLVMEEKFCSNDTVRNLMQANDQRLMAMVWKKTMDIEIPTNNTYYPIVCTPITATRKQ